MEGGGPFASGGRDISWRKWVERRNVSVRIADNLVKTRFRYFPNINVEQRWERKRVPRPTFKSTGQKKRKEIWRIIIILHNEELNDLCSSPNIVRVIKSIRMRWAEHVERMVGRRAVYRVLVWKPEGKRPLERPRRRWEDNIKMDLQEVGCRGMDWIELAQDRDR